MSCDNYVIEDSMLCLHRQGTLNFKTNKSIIYVLKRTKKKCDSGKGNPWLTDGVESMASAKVF